MTRCRCGRRSSSASSRPSWCSGCEGAAAQTKRTGISASPTNQFKAWVFATRGGLYAGTAADTQTAYVKQFLAFVGITDVEFVYAEGLAMGEAPRNQGIARARQDLLRLAA